MLSFLIVFVPCAGIASALMTPAVVYAHRQNRKAAWVEAIVHLPAFLTLYWLMSSGFGRPQSPGNLVEFPLLGAAALLAVYLKVFLVDGRVRKPALTMTACAGLLVGISFALRLLMPTMPE